MWLFGVIRIQYHNLSVKIMEKPFQVPESKACQPVLVGGINSFLSLCGF